MSLYGISLCLVQVSCPRSYSLVQHYSFLYSLKLGGWGRVKGRVGNMGSLNALQALFSNSLRFICITNSSLATSPKHSTVWAAMKKVDHIPAGLSTLMKGLLKKLPLINGEGILYTEAQIIQKRLLAIPLFSRHL